MTSQHLLKMYERNADRSGIIIEAAQVLYVGADENKTPD